VNRTLKQNLLTVPCLGVSLLPKLACPLCWPAYAGLLSSVGLGFLISTKYLVPITAAFLAIAVGALAFRAKNRHGFGPFGLGLLAAACVLVGKFYFESNTTIYAAIAVLVVASVWNAWPRRVVSAESGSPDHTKS